MGSDIAPLPLRDTVYACGFSWRKRALVRQFSGRSDVRFVSARAAIPDGTDLLLWGAAPVPAHVSAGVRIIRLEDGFVRSVGLGADLVRPLSWVLDDVGIYFDATRPSRLEQLLQAAEFAPELLARAQNLRHTIVAHGISKYNLNGPAWQRPSHARVVRLVMGQVETDASIRLGALGLKTNMDLLRHVRTQWPQDWIVYKHHPDVVAGLRRAGAQDQDCGQWADEVLTQGSPTQVMAQVDAVHVMTSLAGFEALLLGKEVHCHGLPFYAGWGLTIDDLRCERRTRTLSLEQLVAGSLVLYPRYFSEARRCFVSAEEGLELVRSGRNSTVTKSTWWRCVVRPFLRRN